MARAEQVLFVAIEWVERHCIIPDGFQRGDPLELGVWQLRFMAAHYTVKGSAKVGDLAPAFKFRRSQIVMPQKAGKAPLTAAQVCLEAVGPALFAGWAAGVEVYRCADYGCRCGWAYAYRRGEPMGRPWPTPLIQITATSEEQTDNIYDALRPMIDLGPLHEQIPKTGEEFIRLPNGGRIDTVTSSARSRLGQRVTFVPQDETGIWTKPTGMIGVAQTQRRGVAGMGGRSVETTNAWDPAEDSVAQRTAESKAKDIFRLHPMPAAELRYEVKEERERIHRFVYAGSPWVDLRAIEAEAVELLERDPETAERFFGNRPVQGGGTAFNGARWAELARPGAVIADGDLVVLGVDGARYRDAIAVIATDVVTGLQWPVSIIEAPAEPPDDYEHDLDAVDDAVKAVFDRYDVWRAYCDPQWIDGLVDRWTGRWGEKKIIHWLTHRERQIAWAIRGLANGIASGEVTNDGDPVHASHMSNAVRRTLKLLDDDGRPMWTMQKPREQRRKIDAAMASVLSWECRGDAIAAGAVRKRKQQAVFL